MLFRSNDISELKSYVYLKYLQSKRRDVFRILIIDDKEVPYIDALRRLTFNVIHKTDIEGITDVEPYHIIICDIKGIGRKISKDKEGAVIIQNIKKLYPEKGLVAYSGGTFDISLNEYFKLADDVILKGSDPSDIADKLDAIIDSILDPMRLWDRIQEELNNQGLSIREINRIRTKYIKSIETEDASEFIKFLKKVSMQIDYASIIRAITIVIELYIAMRG